MQKEVCSILRKPDRIHTNHTVLIKRRYKLIFSIVPQTDEFNLPRVLLAGAFIDTDLFPDEGSSVILNCSYTGLWSWVGPNRSSTSSEKGKDDTMPFTDGCDLNPQLNETNLNVIRYNITNQCSLEINNFSRIDEGLPSNLTIATDNENRNLTVVEGQNISILCQVHSGRPTETVKLIINDKIRGNGSRYTFTPQKSDNNASVICEANSKIMEFPLVKKTRLNVHFKPTSVCTLEPEQPIEDRHAQLCCVVESNPTSNFTWTMAIEKILRPYETNRSCLVWSHINRTHDGLYGFLAENYLGYFNLTMKVQVVYAPVFIGDDIIRYAKIGKVISISAVFFDIHDTHINASIESRMNVIKKIEIRWVKEWRILHGSNMTLNATEVYFQVDLMTRKEFKVYILTVCNSYGCRDIKVDIRIEISKIQGITRSKYLDVETVFAALAVLSVLGIGMVGAFLIWKRVRTNKDTSTPSQTEDLDEDTEGQSVENRLFQSSEIVSSDNPAHVLQAQGNGGYVYHASRSQAESTRNDQIYLSGSHLNYSEVVFEAGTSSNSNIIHGANDKTIYLEIDLVQSASYKLDSCDTSSEEDFIYIDEIVNPERKNELK
ncbi:Hypothetical predicted protein [Mytilus galloprovincialis]|uniref:Ig-like domain-containing protein n=1 Tax=Mytilus galloprovincialis TaxID=29158 RepID=A0A8B6HLT6_MYTGA|nr:Hypothetical predicted protein [Mytilus galloprovincialis]